MGKLKLKAKRVVNGNIDRLNEQTYFNIWGMFIPSFRTKMAEQRGNLNKFLIATWGGLGDVICAEPAIRWAIDNYKNVDFSLASHQLELFRHLKFKETYNLKDKTKYPDWQKYFVFKTIFEESHLQWEFMNHMLCNSVDYVSMNMFRKQLPIKDRVIRLVPNLPDYKIEEALPKGVPWCLIHAGQHWQVKTFPKDWWDAVIGALIAQGVTPVLIGANAVIESSVKPDGKKETVGTVDVNAYGCVDLRNRTSINDFVWLCQQTKVLLSNDSSPIHAAASGQAWIGFVATIKHPDYLMHWRTDGSFDPVYGWRMKDFGRGGVWDLVSDCPNNTEVVGVDTVPDEVLRSWLPDAKEFANWAADHAKY